MDFYTLRGWLVVLLVVAAGFLPVLTLKNRPTRVTFGVIAGVAGAYVLMIASQMLRPDAGLASLVWGIAIAPALVAEVALATIGVAGVVSRLIQRAIAHFAPHAPRYVGALVTLAIAAVLLTLLFTVPPAVSRSNAERFYAEQQASVVRARDGAGPQTQQQLADRVAEVFNSSYEVEEIGDRLAALVHPAIVRNDEVFLQRPNDPPKSEYELGAVSSFFSNALYDHYQPGTGDVQTGDRFEAEWGPQVGKDAIGQEMFRAYLSFYDGTNFDDKTGHFVDRKPVFPQATFRVLNVVRVRGSERSQFVRLYAIDDGGKWWLAGDDDPRFTSQ